MPQIFSVTSDYTVIDRAPLELTSGQKVKTGRTDVDWPGWVWVTADDGRGSYVPEDILSEMKDGIATVIHAFAAHDLSVRAKDQVESIRHVRGWHWCRNSGGQEGWLPAYLLVPVQ